MDSNLLNVVTEFFKTNHPYAYELLEDPDKAMQEDAERFTAFLESDKVPEWAKTKEEKLREFYDGWH
ncbi:hypothetical protein ACO2I3_01970 [Leptospira interrogans]